MFSNQKSKRSRGFRVSTLARTTAFKPISVEEDCNGSVRYELIMPAKPQNQVALPSDVESLLKWSTTLFICPKFKEKRRNHAEMVLQAMYDKDVLNYVILRFLGPGSLWQQQARARQALRFGRIPPSHQLRRRGLDDPARVQASRKGSPDRSPYKATCFFCTR